MSHSRFDSAFREVRSLANQPSLSPRERKRLWNILWATQSKLGEAYEAQWLPYLESFPQHWAEPWVELDSLSALKHAASIAPFATFSLRLSGVYDHSTELDALLESHALSQVRRLSIYTEKISEQTMRALAQSPNTRDLETLRLLAIRTDLTALATLREPGALPALHTLHLDQLIHAQQGLLSILSNDGLPNLKTVRVSGSSFPYNTLEALGHTRDFPTLRSLALHSIYMEPGTLEATQSWEHVELDAFGLVGCRVGTPGAVTLSAQPWVSRLLELQMWRCGLEHEGLLALCTSENLRGLRMLSVDARIHLHEPHQEPRIHLELPCLVHRDHTPMNPPQTGVLVTDEPVQIAALARLHAEQRRATS